MQEFTAMPHRKMAPICAQALNAPIARGSFDHCFKCPLRSLKKAVKPLRSHCLLLLFTFSTSTYVPMERQSISSDEEDVSGKRLQTMVVNSRFLQARNDV